MKVKHKCDGGPLWVCDWCGKQDWQHGACEIWEDRSSGVAADGGRQYCSRRCRTERELDDERRCVPQKLGWG